MDTVCASRERASSLRGCSAAHSGCGHVCPWRTRNQVAVGVQYPPPTTPKLCGASETAGATQGPPRAAGQPSDWVPAGLSLLDIKSQRVHRCGCRGAGGVCSAPRAPRNLGSRLTVQPEEEADSRGSETQAAELPRALHRKVSPIVINVFDNHSNTGNKASRSTRVPGGHAAELSPGLRRPFIRSPGCKASAASLTPNSCLGGGGSPVWSQG